MAKLSVLQWNAGRGIEAEAAMRAWADGKNIEVVLVQEPCARTTAWAGWKWFRSDLRSKTVTWVKESIAARLDESLSDKNTAWVVIPDKDGDINMVNIYDEPPGSGRPCRWSSAFSKVQNKRAKVMIIAGDLNAKNKMWGAEADDGRGDQIVEDCAAEGLLMGNNPTSGPTFVGPMGNSWVDLTFYKGCQITEWAVHNQESLSDHAYITFSVGVGGVRRRKDRAIFDFARANWDGIRAIISGWNIGTLNDKTQIEAEAVNLQNIMSNACRTNIKRKVIKDEGPQWWNAEIAKARSDARKLRKEHQVARDAIQRRLLAEKWKEARRVYKRMVEVAKRTKLAERIEGLCENESWHRAWEALRKLGSGKGEVGVWREDATYTTEQDEIDECLLRKYHPQCSAAEQDELRQWLSVVANDSAAPSDPSEISVSPAEVRETVENSQNGKACGGDAIPNEALKATVDVLADSLARIYTSCAEKGYFPKIWKVAKVVWLPKPKGGYRPISLLPAFGRVFDKILDTRIKDWMEKTGAVSNRQHGFREGRDTIGAVKSVLQDIKNRPSNTHTMMVLLDLSNAFNMAWPPQIHNELTKARAPLYLKKIVASFMTDRRITSGKINMCMERGCPQGSSMGPTLWLMAMQSWFATTTDNSDDLKVQAYADDQCIIIHGASVKKIERKWADIWTRCEQWEREAKMKYNLAKTEMLFIPANRMIRAPVISVGLTRVGASDRVSYLGVYIDWRLNFAGHVAAIREKASKLAPRLRALLGSRSNSSKDLAKIMYDRIVRPCLLYGAEIWGGCAAKAALKKQLLITQRMFLRALVPCYNTTPTQALMVLAGVIPLHIEAERMARSYEEKGSRTTDHILTRWNHTEKQAFIKSSLRKDEMINNAKLYVDYSPRRRATAWVLNQGGNITSRHSEAASDPSDTVGGEVEALYKGLETLQLQRTHLDIFSDSREALRLIMQTKTRSCMVAGVQAKLRNLTQNNSVCLNWLQTSNNPADRVLRNIAAYMTAPVETASDRKNKWHKWALEKWQIEWSNSDKGRELYKHCNEIGVDRLPLSFKGVQLATGHGNFGAYLERFKLIGEHDSAACQCGEQHETAAHILESCPLGNRVDARNEHGNRRWAFRVNNAADTDVIRGWNALAEKLLDTENA